MKDLWTSARSLWIKFCGIADEYKMLRDRWLYLHSKNKLPVLPYLRAKNPSDDEQTFDLLDKHVEELEKLFKDLGFDRERMEDYNKFKQKINKMGRIDIIDNLKLIEDRVYDLANFVGLLKFAFFQRTVSSEIPHVASGMPHSPERTIGNELFYLAADNVARRYYECLRIPYGKWDGFITFTPPIEKYFYGAFYRPSPYLELFHISMSEEAKYFVGSYLALAHEFGHAVIPRKITSGEVSSIVTAWWAQHLAEFLIDSTIDFFRDWGKPHCENCPLYQYFEMASQLDLLELFQDFFADLVAIYIAGKNYIISFIDFAYNTSMYYSYNQIPFLLRTIANFIYFDKLEKLYKFEKYISIFIEDAINVREKDGFNCSDFEWCILNICSRWAKGVYNYNKDFWNYLYVDFERDLSDIVFKYNPFWKSSINPFDIVANNIDEILSLIFGEEKEDVLKTIRKSSELTLFSMIICDEFKIKKNKEKEIIDALIEGTPVPEEDPRHILHCYYEAYKRSEGEERPNYAATIYSLAFNTFKPEQK